MVKMSKKMTNTSKIRKIVCRKSSYFTWNSSYVICKSDQRKKCMETLIDCAIFSALSISVQN